MIMCPYMHTYIVMLRLAGLKQNGMFSSLLLIVITNKNLCAGVHFICLMQGIALLS